LSGESSGRSLAGLFSRLGNKRPSEELVAPTPGGPAEAVAVPAAPGVVYPTKALKKFLATISAREAPVLLDLGSVIGSNVTFFGEALGCKIFVEDLFADLERHVRDDRLAALPEFFSRRLPQDAGSVDGILCWDLIDFLDAPSALALANALTRVLKVDGALLGFFSTVQSRDTTFTKYVVVDDTSLRHRPYPASRGRQRVLQNRDIIKLFEGLRVSDSFLLQTNLREILFRKPAYLSPARTTV
jgi:hypothetical protein